MTSSREPATTPAARADTDEISAIEELRDQVTELRRALATIGGGGVDALVVGDSDEAQVYTLTSADGPYRAIVESMGEGALTVSENGVVLYANPRIATFLHQSPGSMVGRDVVEFVPLDQMLALTRLLDDTGGATRRAELDLPRPDGTQLACQVSATDFAVGGVRLRCLVFTDLSLQKQIEEQRAEEAARHERQQVAVEVNDTIVQGLAAAEMALDLGQHDYARGVVARTANHARHWIGQLAGEDGVMPGTAVRSGPARSGGVAP